MGALLQAALTLGPSEGALLQQRCCEAAPLLSVPIEAGPGLCALPCAQHQAQGRTQSAGGAAVRVGAGRQIREGNMSQAQSPPL